MVAPVSPSALSSRPDASHAAAGAEAIPSFKGLADGRPRVARSRQAPRSGEVVLSSKTIDEYAVVGRDEAMLAALSGNAAANRADAGSRRQPWKMVPGGEAAQCDAASA